MFLINLKSSFRLFLFLSFILVVEKSYSVEQYLDKSEFWSIQKKGTNIFNADIQEQDIKDAKKLKIQFVRVAFDKFKSSDRDFLIGNADNYKGLNKNDLQILKNKLDFFERNNVPFIITMLSLPGSRWKQNNDNMDDLRLWEDKKYQDQSAKFWRDLAKELKNYKMLVGYNILNEPHLERIYDKKSKQIYDINQRVVQDKLYHFYEKIIKEIRKSDQKTPIILDSTAYGDANTFQFLKPQKDQNTIYSFHIYEPFDYTNLQLNKNYSYPGQISGEYWDKKTLSEYMNEVRNFQKKHKIKSDKILVGEFGGNRRVKNISQYFSDLIDIFNKENWHFAFYAFREDMWDGMDYELGDKKLPWSYWKTVEGGEIPKPNRSVDNELFESIIKNYE